MKSPIKPRDLQKVVDGLAAQGCTVRELGNGAGWFIQYPDGHGGPLHKTVSDIRGFRNKRSEVRRHGCQWPLDPGFRLAG